MKESALQAVLFDLDGTLVDTAPDIAAALNALLQQQGRPALDYERIRPVVSQGGAALITLAFPDTDADTAAGLRDEFLELYRRCLQDDSKLFPEMAKLLDYIENHGWDWGIVTNKPAWLTRPLLAAMALDQRIDCLVCGDMVRRPKPDPEPLLLACEQLDCRPQRAVYIGDARRDIEAGRAAGLYTLVAAYGYIDTDEDPAGWLADAIVTTAGGIRDWLASHDPGRD